MTNTQKCDLCGREMLWLDQSLDLDGRVGWVCPATPDQHRIAELEKQVTESEAEIEARGPVAVTKRMTPEGERIVELVRLIGQPSPGSHPDEWYPRAASWHQERANWAAEVERLKAWGAKMKESAEATEGRCEVLADSMNETDAKLAEYEAKVKELESQLRASQERELTLREALENSPDHGYNCEGSEDDETCDYCSWFGRRKKALSNTSATAQEWVAKMKAEVLSDYRGMLLATFPYVVDAAPRHEKMRMWIREDVVKLFIQQVISGAAILGEKEKG